MFRPDLKDTGWEAVTEVVFSISGDNYKESNFNGFRHRDYTDTERRLATLINDELMDLMWEPTTLSELEAKIGERLNLTMLDVLSFRLDFKDWRDNANDGNRFDIEECVYGWVHYKENRKTQTFGFKIDLKGEFTKC